MPLAGEEVRASDVIPDDLTAYTPVWTASGTAPSLGNGILTGAWCQVGALVYVKIFWEAGSTTTFGTSTYRFSLPVAPTINSIIPAFLNDSSANNRWAGVAWCFAASATGDNMRICIADGTGGLTATAPVTLATGDRIVIEGWYEAN